VDDPLAESIFTVGVAVAIVATVLSLGMTFTATLLLAPLRRVRLVMAMLGLNTIALPAGAWGIATAAPVSTGYADGIALCALGSAGAAGLKAAQLSRRADLPLALWLVVILQLANLVAVPLWAGVVVTGGAPLNRLQILRSLILLVLLPLVVGAVVRARSDCLAERLRPALNQGGNLALAVALVTGIAANRHVLLSMLGSWVPVVVLMIVGLGLWLGLLVGLTDGPTRVTTSLVSGTRFSALGLIIVGTDYPARSEQLAAAITFSLIDLAAMLAVAVAIRPRHGTVPRP
jgi:bile acid:Na+ symporter, BASS family